ncbi:putative type II secretion system protein E [Desulfosporosinus acididurans]|uniref:Putative type II secretion system protein E n=1 Tax=Desulfosporosinus acididurans TaxID=476652 RepID=A0A0J1FS98_9FIRM|nr:GspE/PulE family protein [Desulfosporosinus acididurans]KLU66349.1 putative type II secretion system protein E [Desulfosporosinus acididurans]
MKQAKEFVRYLRGSRKFNAYSANKTNDNNNSEEYLQKKVLSQEIFNDDLRRYLGIPEISMTQVVVDPEAVNLIPEEIARRYTLMPYQLLEKSLMVAMADPMDEGALRTIRIITGMDVAPVYAREEEIRAAIRQYLTVEQSVAQLTYLIGQTDNEAIAEKGSGESNGWEEDAPTLRFVYSVLQEAVIEEVSDIHWEPRQKDFVVRYRIDGKLLKKHVLSGSTARTIISSLKVMANMDVAERRIPQDGRMTFSVGTRRVDLRMSSLPTVYGEKIVVRVLNPEMAQRSLEDLGMRPEVKAGVQGLLKYPNGLILVVGPTGSGKTTTLYALLRELNAEEQNIISIEEPVEYQLPGINQVQVNLPAGLTFAVGLRHILRQDPDVIMIGEIRDEELSRI